MTDIEYWILLGKLSDVSDGYALGIRYDDKERSFVFWWVTGEAETMNDKELNEHYHKEMRFNPEDMEER